MRSVPCSIHPGLNLSVTLKTLSCVLLMALALTPVELVFAEQGDAKQEQTREQLRNIEQQLKQQGIELEQQKNRAAQMEKKVECNWALLQSYQRCQEEFDRTVAQQLSCTDEAKTVYVQCMANVNNINK